MITPATSSGVSNACANCNEPIKSKRTDALYCSIKCKDAAKPRRKAQLKPIACATCGEQFQPKRSDARYCPIHQKGSRAQASYRDRLRAGECSVAACRGPVSQLTREDKPLCEPHFQARARFVLMQERRQKLGLVPWTVAELESIWATFNFASPFQGPEGQPMRARAEKRLDDVGLDLCFDAPDATYTVEGVDILPAPQMSLYAYDDTLATTAAKAEAELPKASRRSRRARYMIREQYSSPRWTYYGGTVTKQILQTSPRARLAGSGCG